MANLPTNYHDDVLDTSVNTKRKFTMIDNGDGTYSFDDETVYTTVGSTYGASDINATNSKVNSLNAKMEFLTGGFYLRDVSIDLTNKSYNVINANITSDSLAMVFFKTGDPDTISESGVIANTYDGGIAFTSTTAITTAITCDIYIVAEDTEEEGE